MTIRKFLIILSFALILSALSACSSSNYNSYKTIEHLLGEEVRSESLTHIVSANNDIAIFYDDENIYFKVIRNSEILGGGVFRKEDILINDFYWFGNDDKVKNLFVLWGVFSNTESSYMLFENEPFHPNIINLEVDETHTNEL